MRKFLPLLLQWLALPTVAKSQFAFCDTVPFAYRADSITFSSAFPSSFGDSALIIPIYNGSSTGYAYPQAKIVPLTAMPNGLVLREYGAGWSVFASAWNPGVTMPASMFFDVTAPLPPNASVTFELWLTNLSPLAIDSCKFDSTFTWNFNPQPLGIKEPAKPFTLTAFTKQSNVLISCADAKEGDKLFVCDMTGRQLFAGALEPTQQISMQEHASGLLLIYVFRERELLYRNKLLIE